MSYRCGRKIPDRQAHDLCVAAFEGDLGRVGALLSDGADVDAVARSGSVRGYTALTATCGFRQDGAVAELLLRSGASANLTNTYGRTPLMCAVINSNAEAVSLLLRSGASLEQRHKNQMTALSYARLAVAESGRGASHEAALATEALLVQVRARQRWRQAARLALVKHRFERVLLVALNTVLYRPGGRGAHAPPAATLLGVQHELALSHPARIPPRPPLPGASASREEFERLTTRKHGLRDELPMAAPPVAGSSSCDADRSAWALGGSSTAGTAPDDGHSAH